ncbi:MULTISPECIES: (4Fe-4S)-binding protein [Macrococcoides]|uniref:(4Fe-4S)-binding protein n=1 Tax=Macrococcoides TaxID=3076173 RepID=UPI000A31FFD2|nr:MULTISPECIES: (4Fe-4S)-binding protein [Macrococcus]MDJ1153504.1 (4Fe-4S)-binding protein [Macrococcus caseolyticus]UTH01152.1 (4Fe-4S)-binding protein [Macrococcus canis]UTH12615.1 (4Fe-4S)-binding protein [Macrococcus canis]WBF53981.1 (4Fe-4S)-binding protein [Macrococcus canis]
MKSYSNDEITVHFEAERCIHATECVRGLPQVFDVNKRPWIDVSQASKDEITEVIMRCPSGALTFTRKDQYKEDYPVTEIRTGPDGEIYVKGNIELTHQGKVMRLNRAALKPQGEQLFYTESLAQREDKTAYYKA